MLFPKNPADLTNDELLKELTNMRSKMMTAYTLGYQTVVTQLQYMIESYQYIYTERTQRALENTIKEHGSEFDDIVKVNQKS